MGMSGRLARFAAGATRVLVVESPGDWMLRATVERAALERGWQLADSPADADLLAVCGRPGPDLGALVERVWDQLPGPRARLDVPDRDAITPAFEGAIRDLVDAERQVEDAQRRPSSPDLGDMDHGDMDHGDMDHGDMEMAPGGIPLAEGGPDRDGLEMDVLHLSLGPGLPHWPAGLVLRCSLQGDVVVAADARLLDGGHGPAASAGAALASPDLVPGAQQLARQVDLVVDVLALLGWPAAASAARQVRDLLLAAVADEEVATALARLTPLERRTRRSVVLRRSLRGIGTITPGDLGRHGLPEALLGDVRDRLLRAVSHVPREEAPPGADAARSILQVIPDLVSGLDLAAARLVVASLGFEPSLVHRESAHG